MTNATTDEQRLIGESVARFISQEYEFGERRKIIAAEPGFLVEHWRQFAELGWLALPFSKSDGGLGGSVRDVTVIAEGLGRGLYASPYVSSVILAGGLVAALGSDAQKQSLLEPLISGDEHLAFAYAESQARYNLNDVMTAASADGDGYRVTGKKSVVTYAGSANRFIVSARTSGERPEAEGVSLFIVDKEADGVELKLYPTVDGQRAAEVTLDNAPAQLLGPIGEASAVIEHVCDTALLVLCAEAVGCMGHLYESTLDYIKQREQFGATIGSFQAIQHRMVDVFMSYELARSLTYATASRFDAQPMANERARLASAAKFEISKAGRHIGQEAVQLHGGMGMTEELGIGHYFKRLTTINSTLGDRHYHLERFKRLDV